MSNDESEFIAKPPYVTYRSFISFINMLREHHLPPQIDRSLMNTLSGSVQASLLSALKSMSLIDQTSCPTEEFKNLHDAQPGTNEYREALSNILLSTYPFLTDGTLDIQRATARQLEDKFRDYGISGSTLEKAISFFVSASKEAGMQISSLITTKKSGLSKRASNTRTKTTKKTQHQNNPDVKQQISQPPSGTFTFEVPIYGKSTARISLPKDMTESEWLLIETVIKAQANHMLMKKEDNE